MTFEVDEELRSICEDICSQHLSITEWSLIEASDWFQSKRYCGGFDSIDKAFCFSLYDDSGEEFWFQFTLGDARDIAERNLNLIEARKAG